MTPRIAILDGVEVGDWCTIAAGAVVAPNAKIPPRKMLMGVPAAIVGDVPPGRERDFDWTHSSGYLAAPKKYREGLREISLDSSLQGQIDYTTSPEVVSSDFIGTEKTGVVDAAATIVQGKRCVLYVWYDNEYGYSRQVIRLLQHISGLNLPSFPK